MYPSDLTDSQRSRLEPLLEEPRQDRHPGGRPRKYPLRRVSFASVDASTTRTATEATSSGLMALNGLYACTLQSPPPSYDKQPIYLRNKFRCARNTGSSPSSIGPDLTATSVPRRGGSISS